jgi:hypothetical protein
MKPPNKKRNADNPPLRSRLSTFLFLLGQEFSRDSIKSIGYLVCVFAEDVSRAELHP